MKSPVKGNTKPLGLVWVDCPDSVMTDGLVHALEKQARVHIGNDPPLEDPSSIIFYASDREELAEGVERHRELSADLPPILVFSPHVDLVLAMEALRTGASGFIHASMESDQLVRAVAVAATKGELVAPRELISFLITQQESSDLYSLSPRQREILELVVEGLSNAEIGKRLYLSESTIKQHLRSVYKVLGVSNRTEAANLIRRDR